VTARRPRPSRSLRRTAIAGMLSGAALFVTVAGLHFVTRGADRGDLGPPIVPPELAAPPPPDLMARDLVFPVRGIDPASLADTFTEPRGASRVHNAVDIMAPRGTPVLAVADGTVTRTGSGGAGGTAVYQIDDTGRYAFYYAHLDRLAPGIREGRAVKAGEVLGYVGTSGNAPPNAPHLHFAVYAVGGSPGGGRPINPFPLWRRAAAAARGTS
jgi:murein DD-endopeptidase MepM/ murein hydrolase activator NlpD